LAKLLIDIGDVAFEISFRDKEMLFFHLLFLAM